MSDLNITALPGPSPLLGLLNHKLGTLYGIQLTSVFISTFLFGVSFLQSFMYYMSKHQQNDRMWQRVLPAWLMFLQAFQILLLCATMYRVFVTNFGNFQYVFTIYPTESLIADIFLVVIILTTQAFFVYRIWRFGQSVRLVSRYIWLFPVIFVPVLIVQAVEPIVDIALVFTHHHSIQFIVTNKPWQSIFYSTATICAALEVIFAGAMVWLLTHGTRSTFARTTNIINKLILITINGGLIAAIFACIVIILRVTYPDTFYHLLFFYPLGPLYCNSVIGNLNLRDYVSDDGVSRNPPGSSTGNSAHLHFGPSTVLNMTRINQYGRQFTPVKSTAEDVEMHIMPLSKQ